ncbi:unnamed protein product [Cyclocybe aegerita]|uniref:F-box domain-containing protein n=1 Tax=Cyclocybe aegerita TaxID=1973307 RepID=A0A8S0WAA9_CYCAE|nr:unnamed protein product [Cyclocybe aegerita]
MSRIPFQKGLASYKAGDYQDALEHFNEAEKHGGKNVHLIFDSRAAVYAKLGQKREALRDAKKTIDVAPEKWQGYARAARVFLQLGKPDAAAKMVSMTLERLKEDEADRRTSLLALEAEVRHVQEALEKHRRQMADHTIKLPIELFGEIVKMLVEEDQRALIPLLHVRKHWRSVLESMPSLWDTLVLTQRRPKQKAKLWIQITGGRMRELVVREGAFHSPNWPGDSLRGLQWERLRACRIHRWDIMAYLQSISQPSFFATLDTFELDDVVNGQQHKWMELFSQSDKEELPLQHLSLQGLLLSYSQLHARVSKLKTLHLRNCTLPSVLLLQANPLLEELVLDSVNPVYSGDATLELKHLTLLDLSKGIPWVMGKAEIPELRTLRLSANHLQEAYAAVPQRLVQSNHSHLTELIVRTCPSIGIDILISLVKLSANLLTLEVSHNVGDVTPIVEALSAHLPPSSNLKGAKFDAIPPTPSPPAICPLLTHVNFSRSPNLQTGPLVRLVKSRLPQVDSPSASQECPPSESSDIACLLSLTIDECPQVDAKWLPWFREKRTVKASKWDCLRALSANLLLEI